ncbi:hypothetical protein EJ06DRAFT_555101 [Trichodelitschia bisporula]|uniref:Uncharacterized protein n=1 Tax=Trichodelitschia bisporula TaxID=703511 RepID=A0A6G1I3A9_9PEZI|nr:hypothetical protein EJ06DRAFT_555101 [Trichodelitschia bisporula]
MAPIFGASAPLNTPATPLPRAADVAAYLSSAARSLASHVASRRSILPLNRRQTTTADQTVGIIPAGYAKLNDGPAPGTVVGIVLGSVAGFLLLIYLISMATGNNNFSQPVEEEIVRVERPAQRRRSHRNSGSIRGSVARSRSPRRIIVEERREMSGGRPSIIVDERRGSRPPSRHHEVVEVFEEGSSIDMPPRRHRRRSSGGYSSRY